MWSKQWPAELIVSVPTKGPLTNGSALDEVPAAGTARLRLAETRGSGPVQVPTASVDSKAVKCLCIGEFQNVVSATPCTIPVIYP